MKRINSTFTPSDILETIDTPGLSDYQRSRLSLAGWTRAILSDDLDTALKLSAWIRKYTSALASPFAEFESAEDKLFSAAWIALNYPAVSPYVQSGAGRIRSEYGPRGAVWWPAMDEVALPYRWENWWCTSHAETATISSAFGPHVLRYAKENPQDPRAPRALHRVVFAGRHACSSGPSSISRDAFRLLHAGYPDSEWAKKTPHWYE